MMRSLFSGVSGLKGHQTRMDVIGNNIANVNTTGFKSSRVTFADTLSQTSSAASAPTGNTGGTNPKQIGLGTGVASVDLLFTDGTAQSTGKNTDLALAGNGLFIVKQGNDTYYTRDGAFEFDAEGNYVLPGSGLFVQGWMASDGNLTTTGPTSNIQIAAGKSMASKTSSVATYANNMKADTASYEIGNVLVNYTDGTSETTTSYSPTNAEGKITVALSDGTTEVASSGKTFTTGQAAGDIWTGDVKSLTATTTGTVDLSFNIADNISTSGSGYRQINGGTTGTIAITGLTSGTYTAGGTYSKTKTIADNGVTSNPDGTVTLTFSDPSDGISSVTVPTPSNGTWADGDSFTISLVIDSGTATGTAAGGATVTAVDSDGTTHTSTLGNGTSATLGTSFTKTSTATVQSVTRSDPGTFINNGKTVSSVSVVTVSSDTSSSTTLTALNGQTYTTGDTFYPSVTTTVNVYGSEGAAHSVPVLLTKVAENRWQLSLKGGSDAATINELDGSTTSVSLTKSDLVFDTSGKYVSGTGTLALTYTNGEADQTVTLNLAGLTQYAGSNTVNATTDGNAAGTLKTVAVDSSGIITGTYTNGVKQQEAQVAIAQFTNASGLEKTGNSLYQVSNNSGTPNVKTAADLGCSITPSALEMSNVDIANEFSDMIVTQRGFQSNSKIITVGDEMLETLINMKR
ncbi:MAG: flagellar hook-basal body complex protein [Selenomonas sp.]|uniref:flagellar hook-basal body complex protein n=1 Tax=Selenomonas sp. TaxID=2053611 RepID=UPI0025D88FA3|nr:flagellar hook-basal body complex protein [Selenomonas sp.]MCR5756495.1 flagellar hook-basal body complex protein [Selenomonas sp.]